MANVRNSHDVMTGVAGVHRLVYLITICVMMTSLPRANSQTIPTEVKMTVISEYTNQKYDESLQDQSSTAYKVLNSTACGDIEDAVKAKSAGNISACSVVMAEEASQGIKVTISITGLLDGKMTDERFALIKSAIVQAAAASSTWMVADSDITTTEVEMTVISDYPTWEYTDSMQNHSTRSYKSLNYIACGDIINAVKVKSAGKISACNISMAEQAGNGTKCTIIVTVLLDGKTTDERFALIKSAIVQAANASSTWVVADITINSPFPVTIRLISKRTDLTYTDDYKDPLGYSYSVGNSTMCDDVINALATAAIVRSCEVEHYEAADPGLKAYLKMNLTAKGPEEKQVFMSIGNTIVSAAKDKSRWDVLLKDITLIPAKKPQIDTKSSFKMKIFSTRVDINGTNIPTDTNDEFFKTAKDKMCEDFNDALYTTAVIESCEADNFTSASPGVKATITLSVMSDSATDGFNSTSAQIVSMSSKRDIWTVKPGDILPIEEKTPGPPRSVSSCIVQTPAMFLLLFLLRLLVI